MKTEPLILSAALASANVSCTRGDAVAAGDRAETKEEWTTQPPRLRPAESSTEGQLRALASVQDWLNSPPLSGRDLHGKVVLVDFWTYSCINWRRSLPYVRAWAEKYAGNGLIVVGSHSPEFEFEKDLENVRRATREMEIAYPVAVDSEHRIWRAFANQYWPARYLFDARGRLRFWQFGEGGYSDADAAIRRLLAEAGTGDLPAEPFSVEGRGVEAAADWSSLRSPENYLGYERTQNFASLGSVVLEKPRTYAIPSRLALNSWGVSGTWSMGKEAIVLSQANGRLAYRFHARDVHLVMGPQARGEATRFRVFVDGLPPGSAHGVDVDEAGNGTATTQRLYQLIRQAPPIAERQIEIEFFDPGVAAFSFTFG